MKNRILYLGVDHLSPQSFYYNHFETLKKLPSTNLTTYDPLQTSIFIDEITNIDNAKLIASQDIVLIEDYILKDNKGMRNYNLGGAIMSALDNQNLNCPNIILISKKTVIKNTVLDSKVMHFLDFSDTSKSLIKMLNKYTRKYRFHFALVNSLQDNLENAKSYALLSSGEIIPTFRDIKMKFTTNHMVKREDNLGFCYPIATLDGGPICTMYILEKNHSIDLGTKDGRKLESLKTIQIVNSTVHSSKRFFSSCYYEHFIANDNLIGYDPGERGPFYFKSMDSTRGTISKKCSSIMGNHEKMSLFATNLIEKESEVLAI